VSVILPFLDAEAHLAEAIDSVRRQSSSAWELLLVDDGSSDGSRAIATAAAEADERIRVVDSRAARSGAAAARNVAITASTGDAIAFLDADDVYEPDFLRERTRALVDHPSAELVYGPTRWWYPESPELDWIEGMRRVVGRVHQPPSLLTGAVLLNRSHVPCTCAVLIRRRALEAVGGFDERFYLYEDQTLWVKLFLQYDAYVDGYVGARYRRHSASITSQEPGSGRYDADRHGNARTPREHFLDWVEEYTSATGAPVPAVASALRLARSRITPSQPLAPRELLIARYLQGERFLRRRTARLRLARRRVIPGGPVTVSATDPTIRSRGRRSTALARAVGSGRMG
jgi:hypothetical protein